jgi:hypothetical protein
MANKANNTTAKTTKKKDTEVKEHLEKIKVFFKDQKIIIKGAYIIPDGTEATVLSQPPSTAAHVNVIYKVAGDDKPKTGSVNKNYCYSKIVMTVTKKEPPKDLVKDNKTLTDNQKYMIDLLTVRGHDKTVELALEGVDLEDYDVSIGSYSGNVATRKDQNMWMCLIPKDSAGPMPMLMAHTDIHPSIQGAQKDTLCLEEGTQKFHSPTGLGADDRAGLYAINQVLRKKPKSVMVGFFNLEEVGCIGSSEFVDSDIFETVAKKASAFISIDRRRGHNGAKNIATYDADNKELFGIVKQHTGRTDVHGSSTDCKVLSRKTETLKNKNDKEFKHIACFNMSCGYLHEHNNSEVLYFKELEETVTDLISLIENGKELWDKQFEAVSRSLYGTGYPRKGNQLTHQSFQNDWDTIEDQMFIDGRLYSENDVRRLLKYYYQTSGKLSCIPKDIPISILKAGDTVQLRPNIGPRQAIGGVRLSTYLHRQLEENQWIVQSVNKAQTKADLLSECGMFRADNIPVVALEAIDILDPAVYMLDDN